VATLLALACTLVSVRGALSGWLAAAVVLQSLPLAGLMLLALMRLLPGAWEPVLRPSCEAAARLWPVAALAFVPVLLGLEAIYDWGRMPPTSAFQGAWLGYVQYGVRTTIRFIAFALIARSQVGRQASPTASAAALAVLVLGTSLTSLDWLMSLDPGFHSSGFGLQILSLELAAGAMVLAIARLLQRPSPDEVGLLRGLLLTCQLLWAYAQVMPFLILWSGHAPESLAWYGARAQGGWGLATIALVVLGVGTTLALMLPYVRRRSAPLLVVTALGLAGKGIEFAWFVLPGRGGVAVLAYTLALGGVACLTIARLSRG
jgi:hypothetical protein